MTPEGWKRRKIREFTDRLKRINTEGLDLEPLSITKDRGVILQSEKYSKRIATDPRKYVFAVDGDFAFDPMSLYYGAIGRVNGVGRGLVSPDYVVFSADGTVDSDFLLALLRYPEMHKTYESLSETGNTFGKRRRLYWSVFENIELVLPPLAEQRGIAAILSCADEAISAAQAVAHQLQVVKQALMAELLSCGVKRSDATFKRTSLGLVPEAWTVAPLSSLVEMCDYGLSKALDKNSQGVAVLRMSNIVDGRVVLDDLKYVQHSHVDAELLLAKGDVLFNRTNSKELVGKVGIFEGSAQPVTFASYLLRLRARPARALGEWLLAVMNLDANQSTLRAMATPGVGQVNINRTKMLSLEVAVPPIDEQREVVEILATIEARRAAEAAAIAALKTLKAALLSVLLTGEIRTTFSTVAP